MSFSWRSGSARLAGASIASFLILFAPFLSYAQYQHRGLGHPEVAIFVLLMAGLALLLGVGSARWPAFGVVTLAGLLTLLVDVQARDPGLKRLGLLFLALCGVAWLLRRHVHRIVSLMMATVVLSLWVIPAPSAAVSEGASAARLRVPAPAGDGPLVLHLLLDEFIGVDGVPADLAPKGLRQEITSFFVGRGFRLFSRAYSEYPTTHWSVPHLLNLAPGGYNAALYSPGPTAGSYRLTRNAYFERMAARGYSVQVHEPDYLYLCPDGLPAACRTYPTRSLDVLDHIDLPLEARLSIVAGTYLGQSDMYMRAKEKYRTIRRLLAGRIPLPAWQWERGMPSSAASMPMFDAVAHAVSKARRGTFVFAHILMPHYPYVYDAHCGQRPVKDWMDRSDPDYADIPNGVINAPEGRAARYAAYFQQVACTERKLDELIQAIPPALRDDAVIIVQGDHGSRISLTDPTTAATPGPARSDFADMFSTMFAVRSGAVEPGDDTRSASIACLLRTLVSHDFQSVAGTEACPSPGTVYFMAGGKPPEPRPLPDFR